VPASILSGTNGGDRYVSFAEGGLLV